MMPLFTTTPKRINKPIRALALNREFPVRMSPQNAPTAARGKVSIIAKGMDRDSKVEAKTM